MLVKKTKRDKLLLLKLEGAHIDISSVHSKLSHNKHSYNKLSITLISFLKVHVHALKTVFYTVEYTNGTCSGMDLPSLTLSGLSDFASALDIMEEAVKRAANPQDYEFLTTFSDADGDVGYFVNSIGGTENNAPCFWIFYVRSGSQETRPNLGIADYVPGNLFEVIMRYESPVFMPDTITTTYIIDYPDPVCFDAIPLQWH